ncbi:hypothetical protein [Prauserella flavalba]|uniref:Uncharacterized protein n=1 Tax=Prauserella flavalba TaxID=1477506 RepID=A0A318MG23_9PSEU|nr:hypothetical protein [Prauserella flavalba]PXY38070.1 hypothetical protein BA062_05640 [Prauserella flavalba]
MRNPDSEPARPAARVLAYAAVLTGVPASLLVAGAGSASAAQAEPNAMTFGLLGPVGLVAVVLGILGMTAGVVRQRRKARAAAVVPVEPVPAPAEAAVYSRAGE